MLYSSTKKPGNISSAFSAEISIWPEKFLHLKNSIKPANVEESWKKLVLDLEIETKEIKSKGHNIVPQVNFDEIIKNGGKFPEEKLAEIKKRGCVVVRGVVEREEAIKYKEEIRSYITKNRDKIVGFPENDPQVWEVYWSKSQIAARSHPRFVQTASAVNQLWHADAGTAVDLTQNLTYCDRLRIRQPGDKSFTLKEHIDGGSVERWEDPEYRKCYKHILSGNWELHDPFDATHRVDAIMDLYNCSGGCAMFRSFQGWMSMSDVVPGGGTLRVCPLLKHSSAYFIMRPFIGELGSSGNMAGAIPGAQQNITPELHPHILQAMVSIPQVGPGDCVFWHCDTVHAVDPVCANEGDSSVLYIPSTPLCAKNAKYLKNQRQTFLEGSSPPDFPLNNCELLAEDRATKKDLTEIGQLGMGLKGFEVTAAELNQNQRRAREEANKILF